MKYTYHGIQNIDLVAHWDISWVYLWLQEHLVAVKEQLDEKVHQLLLLYMLDTVKGNSNYKIYLWYYTTVIN